MDEVQFVFTSIGSVALILVVLRWTSGRFVLAFRGLSLTVFVANVLLVLCCAWVAIMFVAYAVGPAFFTAEGYRRDIFGISVKDWVVYISSFVPSAIVDLLVFRRAQLLLRRQSDSQFAGSKLGRAVCVFVALILTLLNVAIPFTLAAVSYAIGFDTKYRL
jgi:hypothetical protein